MSDTRSILFVDAYDSFSRNIIALFYKSISSIDVTVVHINTEIKQEFNVDISTFVESFDAVVIGPGPGDPRKQCDIGLIEGILDVAAKDHIPVLGICLGFQVLCLRYGHTINRLHIPCHGQTKRVQSMGTDIFQDLPKGRDTQMMCYNSLGVQTSNFMLSGKQGPSPSSNASPTTSGSSSPASYPSISDGKSGELELLAWDDEGFAMTVRHPLLPLWGLQFHPESCMSSDGADLIRNWWSAASAHILQSKRRHRLAAYASTDTKSCLVSSFARQPDISMNQSSASGSRSLGTVTWKLTRLASTNSEQLSQLCYRSSTAGPVAMLESVAKGRYCIYGFQEVDSQVAQYTNGNLILRRGEVIQNRATNSIEDALAYVKDHTITRACTGGGISIPFWGGWIGFCSFEMALDLIRVESRRKRTVPDFSFMFVERSVVMDQQTGNVFVQSIKSDDECWVQDMTNKLRNLDEAASLGGHDNYEHVERILASAIVKVPGHEDYTDQIRTCQEHLRAGNSYELCLTSEATVDLPATDPSTTYLLYKNLVKHNPVPFASYLHFPGSTSESPNTQTTSNGTTILSTSPEQFMSWSRDGTLDMIPMKGTVQRTPTTKLEDVVSILSSPKETAENLMIADLIRHDLYGVVGCQRDLISIPALNTIKQFSTVYQLVSHIRAHPPLQLDSTDPCSVISHTHSSLLHTLPPGSMTGAPKKRSCEILSQLENRNRGVYSGIIGYMDVGGGGCWNVAIRTAFSSEAEDYVAEKKDGKGQVQQEKRKIWRVGAGGAVTVLSDVEAEWEEMMGKMNNVLKGFQEVKAGDRPPWKAE